MNKSTCVGLAFTLGLASLLAAAPAPSAPAGVKILLPLQRTAYQTNERIDLEVVRSSPAGLPAGELTLTARGPDGSRLAFTFPLRAGAGKETRQVEHLHLNGRLLRPGKYTLEAATPEGKDQAAIEVYSHVRKTPFKLIDWASGAKGKEQAALGEDSLGFNLLYASYGGLSPDDSIRGGLDYMWCCTMSGAHQMDIRQECDWSDPYVLQGGKARVVRRAFMDRVHPNAVGVHFYDEPGLTWWKKHPVTGEATPHNIPSQDRAFASAFNEAPLQYYKVNPKDPKDVARWLRWGRWKEEFMEAAWKDAAFGVNYVRADFLPVTQSVYGWSAFTDGYYFNVVRSLPVQSGHGGYDDYGGAYFNPSYTFEYGRMRDLQKPNWYLPAWYGGMPADRFRLEQYLSFMNNLQGMAKPPDLHVHRPSQTRATAPGIVESNKLMARLGTIFTTMPVTRPPVAVLYSLSQNLSAQVKDMTDNYEGGGHGRRKTFFVYLAGKLIHQPVFPVVEEDVTDGTLAAHHKVVVLPGVNYLPKKVINALEAFAANGGTVLVSDDSRVQIKGAVKLGLPIDVSLYDRQAKAYAAKDNAEAGRLNNAGAYMKAVEPLAKALQGHLKKLGIPPVLECDNPSIIVSHQAAGDVEYLFAVNASYDAGVGEMNSIKLATATIRLPADGRPVYDAVLGGAVTQLKLAGKELGGSFRFGPGQMRVFARTARPIGGVQVLTPDLFRDYTVEDNPVHVDLTALVADARGRVLAGAIPLRIRVTDPLGVTRFDLYRATDRGTLKLSLPLAANDPAGEWRVTVRELLANKEDTARFTHAPPAQCGAVAGISRRAVSFGKDPENIYRFFQTHKNITIATGASDFNQEAARRLARILKPWGIHSQIVPAADLNRPKEVSLEAAYTWCGLEPGKVLPRLPADLAALLKQGPEAFIKKFDKNGDGFLTEDELPPALRPFFDRYDQNNDKKLDKNEVAGMNRPNNPMQVGFTGSGPVVLLGTPKDNPLIGFLQQAHFLPYQPDPANFPGPGRGYLAWQLDGVGYGRESITLIAYDARGMGQAVGTLYEAASGLRPLTRWELPLTNAVTPAHQAPAQTPIAKETWRVRLPDHVAALKALPDGKVTVLTQDGSLTALDRQGKVAWQKTLTGGDAWALDASADGGLIVAGTSQHLAGFDGTGKPLFDVPTSDRRPAPVVTFVAVSPDGKKVAAGTSDGGLTLLQADGKRLWSTGGVPANTPNVRPNPYLAGIFTNDSQGLVALTQNEAHLINLADGKVKARAGGVSGYLLPRRVGTELLLSDGNSAVLYAPTQNKVVKRLPLPPVGVVTLDPAGAGVVVGGEIDGEVRKLKLSAANLKEATVWESQAPGRIVKELATRDGQTAVVYWGGLVRTFDRNGAVKAERTFTQDATALAWNGAAWVVGLADGRVVALSGK